MKNIIGARIWNGEKIFYSGFSFDLEGKLDTDYDVNVEKCIVLPYTAVNDIKNKRIYLGDILECKEYNKNKIKNKFVSVVMWDDDLCVYYVDCTNFVPVKGGIQGYGCWIGEFNKEGSYCLSGSKSKAKILGNIFENKDLLKRFPEIKKDANDLIEYLKVT